MLRHGAGHYQYLDAADTARQARQDLINGAADPERLIRLDLANLAAQYPQYAEQVGGGRLAQMRRDVVTKMGVAFLRGDVVVVEQRRGLDGELRHTAWSVRNGIHTGIRGSDYHPLSVCRVV